MNGKLILPQHIELEAAKKARNAAFRSLDINWARRVLDLDGASRVACLAMLHMARYECDEMEPELRYQSRDWLKSRGMERMYGIPFPDNDQLPMGAPGA